MTAPPPPIEPAWQRCLDDALARPVAPRPLAVMIERLSAKYRGEAVVLAPADELAARTLFWFPRDLPKVHRAVRELADAGALPARPLRVLDLGAGLGATSLGVLRALPAPHRVAEVTAVDRDPRALELLTHVAANAVKDKLVPEGTVFHTLTRDLAAPDWDADLGAFDLVLAGLSLVELAQATADTEASRGAVIAERVRAILPHVAEDGALILLEPGNRGETRALHHARDASVAAGATVFAPCLHQRPCPMLRSERDWCHEDLADYSLPPWLVPIAKLAGRRWEGITWSYLVLRRDGRTLRERVQPEGRVALRVVSNVIETKGKSEVILCGDVPGEAAQRRVMELEREAKRAKAPKLAELRRGDVLHVAPEALEGDASRVLRLSPGSWEPVP
jgi:SAM-dependent methyltransferase